MYNKLQKITWCLAGVCFLVATILHVSEGKHFNFKFALLIAATVLAFANAYISHKKTMNSKSK